MSNTTTSTPVISDDAMRRLRLAVAQAEQINAVKNTDDLDLMDVQSTRLFLSDVVDELLSLENQIVKGS